MTGDKGPVSLAFMEASDRRHANMMVARTGNIHADISKGMAPTPKRRLNGLALAG